MDLPANARVISDCHKQLMEELSLPIYKKKNNLHNFLSVEVSRNLYAENNKKKCFYESNRLKGNIKLKYEFRKSNNR